MLLLVFVVSSTATHEIEASLQNCSRYRQSQCSAQIAYKASRQRKKGVTKSLVQSHLRIEVTTAISFLSTAPCTATSDLRSVKFFSS